MPEKSEKHGAHAPMTEAGTPTTQSAILVFGTIADTTWRLFVPSVGGTLLGVWGDNSFHTKPWLTLTGIVLGCALAVLLVRQQLTSVKTDKGTDQR
ncbi:AtpZ/AtpI family protein [Candidatus Saccharibacteria bacterium]|nr:AtpZ/AtpI family protein [Candidatus Saccharibacteria bacterium]